MFFSCVLCFFFMVKRNSLRRFTYEYFGVKSQAADQGTWSYSHTKTILRDRNEKSSKTLLVDKYSGLYYLTYFIHVQYVYIYNIIEMYVYIYICLYYVFFGGWHVGDDTNPIFTSECLGTTQGFEDWSHLLGYFPFGPHAHRLLCICVDIIPSKLFVFRFND